MKELNKLVTLKIDHNCLKEINDIFEGLTFTEELDVSYNFLSILSPTIGLMRKLTILRLDFNRLSNIPTGIVLFSIYMITFNTWYHFRFFRNM